MDLTEHWKVIQRAVGLPSPKGIPGIQTVELLHKALKIAAPLPGISPAASLPWLAEANRWLGLKEIPGPKHHAQILKWWGLIRATYADNETAWCAGFVGGCLEAVGIPSSRSAAARSYDKWGDKVSDPVYGSIVTFWRGSPTGWMGHVAFLVGVTSAGDLLCLGGNQADGVNVAKFSRDRLIGFRFPQGNFVRRAAPVLAGPSAYSTNEA